MTIAAGTHLGRYEIRSPLGAGGMGEVYLAQDTKLDRKVALEILASEIASRPTAWSVSFQQKAGRGPESPNGAHVYEIDEADDPPISLLLELPALLACEADFTSNVRWVGQPVIDGFAIEVEHTRC